MRLKMAAKLLFIIVHFKECTMFLVCTDKTNPACPGSCSSHEVEGLETARRGDRPAPSVQPNRVFLGTLKRKPTWFCPALPYKAIPLLVRGISRSESRLALAARGSPARDDGIRGHNSRAMLQCQKGRGWLDPCVFS